jgi:hypothetical protein
MELIKKGDKITIEKTVDGESVGYYENPHKPGTPQVFIVGEPLESGGFNLSWITQKRRGGNE